MRAGLAALSLTAIITTAQAEPVEVTASPVSSFQTIGFSTVFGPFTWRGGLALESETESFGGLSGLVLADNCEDLLAVSDQGNWFRARLTYDGDTLKGIERSELSPILDSKGRPQRNKNWADAETLTPLSDGKIGVAYERRVRFGSYDVKTHGLDAPFRVIPHPKAIDLGPENGEVEAFGLLPSGSHIAIAERQRDGKGNTRAWIWRGKQVTEFSIARHDSYNVTDLVVLPDGAVLTMERSFTKTSLPGMAVRKFATDTIRTGTVVEPELLLEASVPFYKIDNMEGIATCIRNGETRVTLLSDNNFNTSVQSTLLLQFSLTD